VFGVRSGGYLAELPRTVSVRTNFGLISGGFLESWVFGVVSGGFLVDFLGMGGSDQSPWHP
jgi:hypothetical protein